MHPIRHGENNLIRTVETRRGKYSLHNYTLKRLAS
jgi:tRNA(Arg) A34 adenosine deaminase TadA